jgi:polyisoprenoid-binding protein YceI
VFSKLTQRPVYLVLFLTVFLVAACGGTSTPAAAPASVEEPTTTSAPVEEPAATSTPAAESVTTSTPNIDADSVGQEETGLRTFVIVPEETKASYLVDEEFFGGALARLGIQAGLVDVIGSTQEVEGELQLNLDDLSSPLGANYFTVNLTSLTTDQSRRDNWVRQNGPQFNTFPTAEFTATAIEAAPATYQEGDEVQFKLLGDLTIREITQPITFDVTAKLEGDTITGVATAQLLMTDFGIDPPNIANTLSVENEFAVQVEFTAEAQ